MLVTKTYGTKDHNDVSVRFFYSASIYKSVRRVPIFYIIIDDPKCTVFNNRISKYFYTPLAKEKDRL